ncbi:prepilin-type N-terminal cleavage/methylation domain-containing protein [Hyphomicrobium sp.]|uniref:prepilin-type N-terminal cleavage/methylation domain-containing protein n=1 Tax=Hyphomicrobium sp. TaxID=82 RepID=UPI002E36BCD0|nr:prepilin-type N-terminal cleavage/methylation domain-containing protein [Hyphomicrobium sp.]HEX2841006.1 prepilin-type N-terminal cleavage/methylation domain-containing protein [Hyphomicrobium sp.]
MIRRAPPSVASDQGFTLLELLLALSIAALAAAVVVPRVSGVRDTALVETAARKLAAAAMATRAASVRASEDRVLVIDLAARRYWSDGVLGVTRLPPGLSIAVPRGGTFDHRALLRFRPDGSATEAEIRIRKGRRSSTISIDWLTGSARVS